MYITDPSQIPQAEQERFRFLVEACVSAIYGGDAETVSRYFEMLSQSSTDEQLLALHLEPLALAADLCDRNVSLDDIKRYENLTKSYFKQVADDFDYRQNKDYGLF